MKVGQPSSRIVSGLVEVSWIKIYAKSTQKRFTKVDISLCFIFFRIKMRVLMTGSASCLGAVLLPVLCESPRIAYITGIDIKPTPFRHPKLRTLLLDIRNPDLSNVMANHDAVIHLAFVVKREGRSEQEMVDVNVRGSQHVVQAALHHRIRKFINLSSVSVYGSGRNLQEQSRLAPSAGFAYAQHKAELERYINVYFPEAIQLRSHLIIGAHAQPFLKDMLRSRVRVKFTQAQQPQQQVVHEQDVVSAIMLALCAGHGVSGAFNLAAPDIVDLAGEYIKRNRRLTIPLSYTTVNYLANMLKRIRPKDEYQWIDILGTTLTVCCERSRQELGWIPEKSAWEAREDAIRATV